MADFKIWQKILIYISLEYISFQKEMKMVNKYILKYYHFLFKNKTKTIMRYCFSPILLSDIFKFDPFLLIVKV